LWILQYLKNPHAIKVVTSVQERIDGRFIPDSWVSAYYLRRCYERKGGKEDGYIKSFEEEFGRYGKKKVCYLTIKLFIIALAFFSAECQGSCWILVPKEIHTSQLGHCNCWRQVLNN
jgi:hypothetical protein